LNNIENNFEKNNEIENSFNDVNISENIPSGVSIENASFLENSDYEDEISSAAIADQGNVKKEEEYAPKLFSEELSDQLDNNIQTKEEDSNESNLLFDQDINEEEDFEIPAFLRKQKF